MNDFFKSIERGFGFAIGFFILAGLFIGVYAFVQPSSGPTVDYYLDSNVTFDEGNFIGSNRIPTGTYPLDYTEVCFKEGTTYNDQNSGGSSTTGGNCEPGDRGYIIEQEAISPRDHFSDSLEACLQRGMRLPNAFEIQHACRNNATFGITFNDYATNSSVPEWVDLTGFTSGAVSSVRGPATISYAFHSGSNNCNYAGNAFAAKHTSNSDGAVSYVYRCAK